MVICMLQCLEPPPEEKLQEEDKNDKNRTDK